MYQTAHGTPDWNPLYQRPAAWRKAKEALGIYDGEPCQNSAFGLLQLEKLPDGCPRILLTAACLHFCTLPSKQRAQLILDMFDAVEAERALLKLGLTDEGLDAAFGATADDPPAPELPDDRDGEGANV